MGPKDKRKAPGAQQARFMSKKPKQARRQAGWVPRSSLRRCPGPRRPFQSICLQGRIPLPEDRSDEEDFELGDEDLELLGEHRGALGFLDDLPTKEMDR